MYNIVWQLYPVFFYHANEVQKNCKKEDVCRCGGARPFFCPLERGWYPWATNGHYPCSTTHYYSMPSWHAIFQFAGMAWPGGMRHGTSRKRSSTWEIHAVPSREHQAFQDRLFQKVRTQTDLPGSLWQFQATTIGKGQVPRGSISNGKPWATPTAPCREATRKSFSCCW